MSNDTKNENKNETIENENKNKNEKKKENKSKSEESDHTSHLIVKKLSGHTMLSLPNPHISPITKNDINDINDNDNDNDFTNEMKDIENDFEKSEIIIKEENIKNKRKEIKIGNEYIASENDHPMSMLSNVELSESIDNNYDDNDIFQKNLSL